MVRFINLDSEFFGEAAVVLGDQLEFVIEFDSDAGNRVHVFKS